MIKSRSAITAKTPLLHLPRGEQGSEERDLAAHRPRRGTVQINVAGLISKEETESWPHTE
jgi:hypothetical protein